MAGNPPAASPNPIIAAPPVSKFRRLRPSPRKAIGDSQQTHREKNSRRAVLSMVLAPDLRLLFGEVSTLLLPSSSSLRMRHRGNRSERRARSSISQHVAVRIFLTPRALALF